jgi:DHA3 family macrolide efflux protein-like MFS transporter
MKNTHAILLLLVGNTIAGVAQGISMIAVPWYFTNLLNQESLFGQMYFAVTAISLFWGIYAGAIVDRYNRKHVFLAINLTGLLVFGLLGLWGELKSGLGWIGATVGFATTSFVYNIHFPNLYAFAHEITEKEHYGAVTSKLEVQGQIAFTLAGGVAAVMLNGFETSIAGYTLVFEKWELHQIFWLNAAAYLLTLGFIYAIRSLPVAAKEVDFGSLISRLKTGFDFLKSNPHVFLFGNASLLLFLTILICATYLFPIYVDKYLQAGGHVYALSDMVFSFGALLAGIFTTRIFAKTHPVRGIILLSGIAGLMYLLMVFTKTPTLFLVANFVIGVCNASVRIQRVTQMFNWIPNRLIGRVNSVFFVVNVTQRLLMISIFTIPFFHHGKNILYPIASMAVICFIGASLLWKKKVDLTIV